MYEYTIKNARKAKGIRITIYQDCRVTVTKPRWVTKKYAEEFVQERHEWILRQIKTNKDNPNNILGKYGKKEFVEKKEEARELVHKKLEEINKYYGFEYGAVSIRNQRTRWGSCSSKRNLSFNFKIVYLPVDLQDYLIAHELCHLKHMNHGKDFWNCVAIAIPDHLNKAKRLKNGDI
jgi:predicted metal-dependent hydrolase